MIFPSCVSQVSFRIVNQVSLYKYSEESVFQLRSRIFPVYCLWYIVPILLLWMSASRIALEFRLDELPTTTFSGLPIISIAQLRNMCYMMLSVPGVHSKQKP